MEYLASQASHTTIVLGELGGNIPLASPAGLAGVKPGSDLSADCVVSCQTVWCRVVVCASLSLTVPISFCGVWGNWSPEIFSAAVVLEPC